MSDLQVAKHLEDVLEKRTTAFAEVTAIYEQKKYKFDSEADALRSVISNLRGHKIKAFKNEQIKTSRSSIGDGKLCGCGRPSTHHGRCKARRLAIAAKSSIPIDVRSQRHCNEKGCTFPHYRDGLCKPHFRDKELASSPMNNLQP